MSAAQNNSIPLDANAAPMAYGNNQMYGDAEGNHNEVRYENLREGSQFTSNPPMQAPAAHSDNAEGYSNNFSSEASKPTPPAAANSTTDAPLGVRNNSFNKSNEVAHKDFAAGSKNPEGKVAHASLQGRTYTHSEGLPPAPAAVLDATPDVWYRDFQAKRETEEAAQEEERVRELKKKKEETKGGLGYKMGKFFSNTAATVNKSVNDVSDANGSKAHEANMKQAKARLAKYWPGHSADELIAEFDCEALHYNVPVRGHVLLTHQSLLFIGKGKNELLIVEEILLDSIVSYSRGVSVPCVEQGARWVIDLPNQMIQPDALQIFTRSGMHFDFINISHSIKDFHDGHEEVSHYDRFINFFDHQWRAAKI